MTPRTLRMFALTWNVNETLPDQMSGALFEHLRSVVGADPGLELACFGLQEIEMGSASVAAAATKEFLGQKKSLVRWN